MDDWYIHIYDVLKTIAQELAAFWPIITAILAIFAMIRFASNRVRQTVREEIQPLKAELSPNGGSSVKDQIQKITEQTKDLSETQELHSKNQGVILEAVKKVGSDLSAAAARVQALRATTDQPYIEMDKDLNHTFVNQAYTDLFGVDYDEALGDMNWEQKVHPDDVYRLHQIADGLKSHPSEYVTESRILNRKRGTIQHIVSYGYPMFKDGILTGYSASVQLLSEEPLPERFK